MAARLIFALFFLLVVGWLLHQRGASWGSAAVLVAVVTIKPAFVTMLALIVAISGTAFFVRAAALGLAAGLLSIAVMRWPIHARFLDFMAQLSGQSTAWAFGSGVTVPLESIHLAWDSAPTIGGTPGLSAAVVVVRLTVCALFAWLLVLSRRQAWDGSARRRVEWAIGVMFCLMVAPVVWEHYLAILFLPLALLVASEDRLPPAARRFALAAVALGCVQNLVVVDLLWDRMIGAPWPLHVGVALVKAGPLLLTGLLLVRYRRAVFACFAFEPSPGPATESATGSANC